MVSKKGTKKIKAEKPETPAVEPITAKPNLEKPIIIKEVVDILLPEISKRITSDVTKSFDEIKKIVATEFENIKKQPVEQIEEPVAMEQPTGQPDLSNIDPKEKSGLEALLPLIMPLLAPTPAQPAGQNGLMQMFMESMMRNSMANLTRNDGMQDLMMKAAFKKILGEDPPANIMKTTDELMSPLNNYGAKAQAAREKAKSNL